MDKRPIGIFDSGLGGLSAVKAALKYMPNENIVYFGDTQRVPYGSRSEETIESFAAEDIAFLEKFNCKLIMAACGTVSSVAVNATSKIKEPFVGVVKPSCKAAVKATRNGRIGVMATAASINSGAYTREIQKINPDMLVEGVSCPVLVTLVENNWIDEDDYISREIIKRYSAPLLEKGVDTIILGCTHFPHLAPLIQSVVGKDITLIDSGYEAVMEAKRILQENEMENISEKGENRYFVSDKIQNFSCMANTLLGIDISDKVEYRNITE
ncbi:MAG: glutamate racemase [Eubacterium sp.]|nr:glutamate racemase [Eubacterium sp.]